MTQFPINLAEAVTGHKLQGCTLDKMIVTGWGLSCMKNWEYTVLARDKTREGLFLLTPLDPNKHYGPTEQFRRFIEFPWKILEWQGYGGCQCGGMNMQDRTT
jgi:hypothetical protein